MKRRILVIIALAAATAACSEKEAETSRPEDAPSTSAWGQPPRIEAVARIGAGLIVRGSAGPGSRVVLRGVNGEAVAVNADGAGRFELRLPPLSGDVLLIPEVQVGEEASAAPAALVVIQGGAGPVALLAAGEPTVRLDGRGVLDAVDSDGAVVMASGAVSEEPPSVTIAGRPTRPASAGGRWRATAPGAGDAPIVVDGRAFLFPGPGSGDGFGVERAGGGWRITWPTPPHGRQTTWLPDRPS